MTKSEWGTKRSCLGCGVAFYDLKKSPIVCPKCGEKHDPQPLLKPRRTGPTPKPVVVEKKAPVKAEETDEDIDLEEAGVVLETDDDDDLDDDEVDENLIEDATNLVGGDDDEDDVAEVKEHLDTDDDKG